MIIPGYELSDEQLKMFEKYYELLIEWNNKFNLTAITDKEEVEIKHFSDSLSLLDHFNISDVHSLIDVGTGAGFPGIPLKIACPHLRVTLLDSLQKRVTFLNEVVKELGLTDVTVIHGRAEDLGRDPEHREKYDLCVSRAVANLSSLTELCLPFVNIGGFFVSYKSEKTEDEMDRAKDAIKIMGGGEASVQEHDLKFKDDSYRRTLILMPKKVSTPEKYPRKAGLPTKKPL